MTTCYTRLLARLLLAGCALLPAITVIAQDGGTDASKVSVSTTSSSTDSGGTWYAAPWVWIVGAAVFILLLVAVARGGGRRAD